MKDILKTPHAAAGAISALLTGSVWLALMWRFGHLSVSEFQWWMPALPVALAALGFTVGAIGQRRGSSALRVALSTVAGTGISPFGIIPIILVTIYPLGKLAERLGLLNAQNLSRDVASNIVIAAMLVVWVLLGAALGALLLHLSISRPASSAVAGSQAGHAA